MPTPDLDQAAKSAAEAVKAAAALKMDAEAWKSLAISAGFGGGTSLLMALREKKVAVLTWTEILSSAIIIAIIAAAVMSYCIDKTLPRGINVIVGVACGLGGDGLIKGLVAVCAGLGKPIGALVKRLFGDTSK